MILIKNAKVLPELVEGYDGKSCDILLEGENIQGVYPCGAAPTCPDAEVIDANGRYVLPGFFDMHVHLSMSGGDVVVDNDKTAVQLAYDVVKACQDSLKAGFTTIRDVGSYFETGIEVRNAINKGFFVGPNVYSSGRALTPTETGNELFGGMYYEADGVDEIWKGVRKQMQLGADFIKVMGTGAVMNPGGDPGAAIYTLDEMKAIVEAAAFKGTYVAVHTHGTQAIKNDIIAGVRTIEHATMMDDECIEMLTGNKTTYIVPTLKILWGLQDISYESSGFMAEKAKNVMSALQTGIKKAYAAGLLMGFGTDTGAVPLYHGENADEFAMRRDFFGMKEIDLIKQATINSAVIMGVDDRLGSIKAGKLADLVIVDGDPLERIEVLRECVDLVIKSGQVVTL